MNPSDAIVGWHLEALLHLLHGFQDGTIMRISQDCRNVSRHCFSRLLGFF